MKRWLVLALLFVPTLSFGQAGVRYDNIALRGTNPLQGIANATITVCTSAGTGIPCTPLATTYTDATLVTPCPAGKQVVLANTNTCVTTGDTFGNFGFWIAAGTYVYTVTATGLPGYSTTITSASGTASSLLGPGSISGTFSGNPTLTGNPIISGALNANGGGNLSGTFTGNPTLSGNPTVSGALNANGGGALNGTFSGPTTLSGNLTVSGTGTFTGAITCTIINVVRCISPSNPQSWAGADPIAWINSAYANCAAASLNICPIQVAAGTYPSSATLLNFSTLNVYPQLQCPALTTLTFSATSGTAITVNPGRAGLPGDWGISGCKFVGSGLGNTLTGILSGGTNGAVGMALRGIQMYSFNIALTFAANVQGWLLDHSTIADNNQNPVVPASQSQTGEGMIFQNNTFGNTSAVWSATCISIGNAGATFYNFQFIGGSIDQCGVTIGNGSHTVFQQVHWENAQSVAMSAAYLTCSGGVCTVNGNLFVSEQAAFNPGCSVVSSCFIDSKSGASIEAYGNEALNSGNSAMSGFVHICATCKGNGDGNEVGFGSQSLPAESIDSGGQFKRGAPNGITMYGGNNTSGSTFFANSGQTIGGVTGTLFGFLQPGVAHLGEIDTSGNLGMLGSVGAANLKLAASGTVQNQAATATMGLTLKKGSGGGNYTTASTTYVVPDSTNLCGTFTIPVGWKLAIQASGSIGTSTAIAIASAALTDNAACSTANAGLLTEAQVDAGAIGGTAGFSLSWVITGDGAAHNIALQVKTAAGADSVLLLNSSATALPTMVFTLMPSN